MKKLLSINLTSLKKYFSEKNALTITASLFCFVMMILSFTRESVWEAIGFALAFSFSIEVICHRTKEKN